VGNLPHGHSLHKRTTKLIFYHIHGWNIDAMLQAILTAARDKFLKDNTATVAKIILS